MKLIGYGEDALTLWALRSRLTDILRGVGDATSPRHCKVFFRPSFGRRGGPHSSQFGECDFAVVTRGTVYLGESKWHRSTEDISNGQITIRPEQIKRHEILSLYIERWCSGEYEDWPVFVKANKATFVQHHKPIAPIGSLLAENLREFLGQIKWHLAQKPPLIRNILVYFYASSGDTLPDRSSGDFSVICLDYSARRVGNFIEIE